ncbi:MAG: SusC/RagA family TonB-linked outer membrane protein [Gemmatimonadaceae bacterium]|nr:SusC/RagA family TonB-linked outer membrane protein [Gemmatimonadaceae bacterium]
MDSDLPCRSCLGNLGEQYQEAHEHDRASSRGQRERLRTCRRLGRQADELWAGRQRAGGIFCRPMFDGEPKTVQDADLHDLDRFSHGRMLCRRTTGNVFGKRFHMSTVPAAPPVSSLSVASPVTSTSESFRMVFTRCLLVALAGGLLTVSQLPAQGTGGTITGRVVDSTSQQPLANVQVQVVGTPRGALTRADGGFTIVGVPAGSATVRATRLGFNPQSRTVSLSDGQTVNVEFSMSASAINLQAVVVVGYGTQRREAVTGAVATVDASEANVGVVNNANAMLTARVTGVNVISNNGEPGANAQIRIRGGTSISASNDPLYVIDGVPIQNDDPVAAGVAIGGSPALGRSPLNALNPSDIQSITILKDASATAIYGSRGANGVVLIETKKGSAGVATFEFDSYVAASRAANSYDLLTGSEYRAYIEDQIAKGNLQSSRLTSLGAANNDWEDALLRTGIAQNHNLSISGGNASTRYRATLNYFEQQGIVISNGLRRYQGRINANNSAFGGKVQSGLNLSVSRVQNDYLPFDNTAGFDGGVFTNMVSFDPTQPVRNPDGSFYEVGAGAQSIRNPVALARQISDEAPENRTLGNFTASYGMFPSLTWKTTLGADIASSVRQTYFPLVNPVGASTNGRARQAERSLSNLNFQGLVTWAPQIGGNNELEVLGGYEFSKFENQGFEAEMRGFVTDAFKWNNLGAGTSEGSPPPVSYIEQSRLASFFTRANLGFKNRYFLTGVLRNDGSSRLAPGNKWAVFPAVSASWRLSEESFIQNNGLFSNLSVRLGWGVQGNQAVRPYGTQLLLRTTNDARYPFGNSVITGFAATQVPNPDLKWETSTQINVGIDYGFKGDRFTGTLELYRKKTKDLLFDVPVAQPAVVATRLENVGSLNVRGFEASLDAQLFSNANSSLTSGLVFTMERNEIDALGLDRQFIITGSVNGQGQSGKFAQRLIPGQPIGTFWGAEFAGYDAAGVQLFNKYTVTRDAAGRELTRTLSGTTASPGGDDEVIIGNANPSLSLGFRSNATWKKFDASWLWRAEIGRDVFNNTALVYGTASNVNQSRNFLRSALKNEDALGQPAIYSSRWIEDGSFFRLQNLTVGYTARIPGLSSRDTRLYVSGDNLLLFTPYSGYDPEVFVNNGLATRGVDYLIYPRARTFTAGFRVQF